MSRLTGQSVRHETITSIVRQLNVVVSRRVGQAVGLWGEPGIGKTHAAQLVLHEIPCQSLSLHATASEASIVQALPRPKRLPVWAQTQLERAVRGEPLDARAFADALTATLAGLAPFVLHLEDVHEASPERLEMIEQLARAVARTRGVGLLVTSRSELPEPFRNHHLEPLGEPETTGLLEREIGADLPREGLEWIQSRTMGNPLFALEFARYLTRQGFLWSDGKRWNWRAPPEGFVPVTVEALISQLVSSFRSMPEVQAALEARAILPDELPTHQFDAVWTRVADIQADRLESAKQELGQAGILRGKGFTHPLFREVIEHDLSPARRRALARRAIEAIEGLDVELAAGLVERAALEIDEARSILRLAATQAQVRGHQHRAGHWLALAAKQADDSEGLRLALEASRHLGFHEIERATRLAEWSLEQAQPPLEAVIWLTELLCLQGQAARAETLLRQCGRAEQDSLIWWQQMIRVLGRHDDRDRDLERLWFERPEFHHLAKVMTVSRVASIISRQGRLMEAKALWQSVFERDALSASERSDALHDLALTAFYAGDFKAVEQHLLEAIALERSLDRPYSLSETLRKLASIYVRLGRHAEALEPIREASRLAAEGGHPRIYAICLGTLGTLLMNRGEFEEAEMRFLERQEIMHRSGSAFYRFDAHADLALLYLEWQPPHGGLLAIKHAQLALEHARRGNNGVSTALAHLSRAQASIEGASRALETARASVEAAGTDVPEDQALARLALGMALCNNGLRAEALAELQLAMRGFDRLGMSFMSQRAGLEIDVLTQDRARALERSIWFESNRLSGGLRVAQRYFPQLNADIGISSPPVLPPSDTRIRLLGPLKLERDGEAVTYRGRKRTEILAFLLEARIAGRSEVSALDIVDALYPDEPEIEARNTLKQQVYLIRSGLGTDTITSTPNGYALGAISSDAEDYLRTGDAGLWRGAYLAGLGEGWVASVRDALILALRSTIETSLVTDALEAARLGRILCEMEPYDPDALQLAMRALEAAGDVQAALQLYLQGRARLLEVGEALPASPNAFLVAPA